MPAIEEILLRHSGVYADGTVRYAEEGSRVVLNLSGSLDLERSHRLQKFLVELVDNLSQHNSVELDMSNVRYISSTGVGALVNALVAAKRKDLPFKVYGFQPKVRAVFRLLGLLSFFEAPDRQSEP
jgi:anti-anti-sigma factor